MATGAVIIQLEGDFQGKEEAGIPIIVEGEPEGIEVAQIITTEDPVTIEGLVVMIIAELVIGFVQIVMQIMFLEG